MKFRRKKRVPSKTTIDKKIKNIEAEINRYETLAKEKELEKKLKELKNKNKHATRNKFFKFVKEGASTGGKFAIKELKTYRSRKGVRKKRRKKASTKRKSRRRRSIRVYY